MSFNQPIFYAEYVEQPDENVFECSAELLIGGYPALLEAHCRLGSKVAKLEELIAQLLENQNRSELTVLPQDGSVMIASNRVVDVWSTDDTC